MPWKHWWHQWLTKNWLEEEWNGWPGNLLRCVYLTVAFLGTLLVSPSLLSVFLHSFPLGFLVSALVFCAYSWVVVGHYPEPAPDGL